MEKQERRSRIMLLIAFLLTLVAVALLSAAMGSGDWVNAEIQEQQTTQTSGFAPGSANHGLFKGMLTPPRSFISSKQLVIQVTCSGATRKCRYDAVHTDTGKMEIPNTALEGNISLDEYCRKTSQATGNLEHPAEWSFWLWLSTVVFLSLAIFFALIVAITTMINVIYVPISDIAGVQGVYVWNFVACLFTLISICVWVGLHYSHLRYNILPSVVLGWGATTCGLAQHGSAIWFCVAALVLFFLNVVIIRLRRGTSSITRRHNRKVVKYVKGQETLY